MSNDGTSSEDYAKVFEMMAKSTVGATSINNIVVGTTLGFAGFPSDDSFVRPNQEKTDATRYRAALRVLDEQGKKTGTKYLLTTDGFSAIRCIDITKLTDADKDRGYIWSSDKEEKGIHFLKDALTAKYDSAAAKGDDVAKAAAAQMVLDSLKLTCKLKVITTDNNNMGIGHETLSSLVKKLKNTNFPAFVPSCYEGNRDFTKGLNKPKADYLALRNDLMETPIKPMYVSYLLEGMSGKSDQTIGDDVSAIEIQFRKNIDMCFKKKVLQVAAIFEVDSAESTQAGN